MDNSQRADLLEAESIPERDVRAMLGMLDYLIAEISKIDEMSAKCLMVARRSLAEVVDSDIVRAH